MPEPQPAITAPPSSVTYGVLKQLHCERDLEYLAKLWAFYKGGNELLGNKHLMDKLFPAHRGEFESVYTQRRSLAFYIGICGEIVDYLTATLMSDPIRVGLEEQGVDKLKLEGWYAKFVENVAHAGAPKVAFVQFLREAAQSLLVTRETWDRVDLPKAAQYETRKDQEEAGALDAWLVHIPTTCVLDWGDDENGALQWCIVYSKCMPRAGLLGKRDKVVHRWIWYDAKYIAEYELTVKADQSDEPKDDQVVTMKGEPIEHRFGRIPIVRKTVPDGLWAMDTLESVQREHFNKRNALAWGERQSLLPELYEFMGPEAGDGSVVIGANQKDPERAVSQPRGQGYVQKRGADDRAEFVGPPVEPFVESRKSCQELRDEMHRVLHLMALSVANTTSALGRSAASKAQDKESTNIVCGELGRHIREHAVALMEMVSLGRGDQAERDKWRAQGAEQFVVDGVDDVIDRAVKMEGVTVKSTTFRKKFQSLVAEAALGAAATPNTMASIDDELEENITDDDLEPMEVRRSVDLGKPMNGDDDEPEDKGEDETKTEAEPKDAAKAKGKRSRKRTAAGK